MAVEYKAKLNYLRMAPRKVRSVGDLIKGLPVNEAEAQLLMQARRPAKPLLKLLRSAIANAKNNGLSDAGHLYIASLRVDGGPMLKRILPRARGSASPIEKKMSHVTLILGVNEAQKPRFTIVAPKKKKPLPGETGKRTAKKRTAAPKADEKEAPEMKQKEKRGGNFWKRSFNRKTIGE